MNIKVLEIESLPQITALEEKILSTTGLDEIEQQFVKWNASWRQESLEHYLPLGWSFGIWNEAEDLIAYTLAQPLLFFKSKAQSLWIEQITAIEPAVLVELIDVNYKLCREKHMQNLLLHTSSANIELLQKFKPVQIDESTFMIRTTKGIDDQRIFSPNAN